MADGCVVILAAAVLTYFAVNTLLSDEIFLQADTVFDSGACSSNSSSLKRTSCSYSVRNDEVYSTGLWRSHPVAAINIVRPSSTQGRNQGGGAEGATAPPKIFFATMVHSEKCLY